MVVFCWSLSSQDAAHSTPKDPLIASLQLAQIDYGPVHAALIERCRTEYGESAHALEAAITQWDERNADALKELKTLGRERLRQLLPNVDVRSLDEMGHIMTEKLRVEMTKQSGPALKAACEGQYAQQSLDSPLLDFASLVRKLRVSQPSQTGQWQIPKDRHRNVSRPIFSQLVVHGVPNGWKSGYEHASATSYIQEFVPDGESVQAWTEMITVRGFKDLADNPKVSPQTVLATVAAGIKSYAATTLLDNRLVARESMGMRRIRRSLVVPICRSTI
jgi:hypothetical protein